MLNKHKKKTAAIRTDNHFVWEKELTEPSSAPIELIISSCSAQGTGGGGIKKEEKKIDGIVKIEEQSFCNGGGRKKTENWRERELTRTKKTGLAKMGEQCSVKKRKDWTKWRNSDSDIVPVRSIEASLTETVCQLGSMVVSLTWTE